MSNLFDQWKQRIEELEKDLAVKKEEISEAFEKQKSHISSLIDKAKNDLQEKLAENPSRKEEIQRKLEELQVQLALGKAETRDAFEAQKKKVDQSLHQLHQKYEEMKEGAGEKNHQLSDSFGQLKDYIQQKLDIFNLHFHLGKLDATEEWERQKKEFNHHIFAMKQKIHEKNEAGESKWEEFNNDMNEAIAEFRKGMKNLFS